MSNGVRTDGYVPPGERANLLPLHTVNTKSVLPSGHGLPFVDNGVSLGRGEDVHQLYQTTANWILVRPIVWREGLENGLHGRRHLYICGLLPAVVAEIIKSVGYSQVVESPWRVDKIGGNK